jgi:hypothetical protein
MKIVLTEWSNNWRGQEPQKLKANLLDLSVKNLQMYIILNLGNGNFDDTCFEVDSDEALHWIRNLLCNTGGAVRVTDVAAGPRKLYRVGYEIYRQGDEAFFFVNPEPRPDLFANTDLSVYESEFL